MTTENTAPKFHWSKIPAVKFQFKPSINMFRGSEEIEINQRRRKTGEDNVIVAVFDKKYVIEVCSRFFNNLLLSDISREEWQSLCDAIWISFYPGDTKLLQEQKASITEKATKVDDVAPVTASKSKTK